MLPSTLPSHPSQSHLGSSPSFHLHVFPSFHSALVSVITQRSTRVTPLFCLWYVFPLKSVSCRERFSSVYYRWGPSIRSMAGCVQAPGPHTAAEAPCAPAGLRVPPQATRRSVSCRWGSSLGGWACFPGETALAPDLPGREAWNPAFGHALSEVRREPRCAFYAYFGQVERFRARSVVCATWDRVFSFPSNGPSFALESTS